MESFSFFKQVSTCFWNTNISFKMQLQWRVSIYLQTSVQISHQSKLLLTCELTFGPIRSMTASLSFTRLCPGNSLCRSSGVSDLIVPSLIKFFSALTDSWSREEHDKSHRRSIQTLILVKVLLLNCGNMWLFFFCSTTILVSYLHDVLIFCRFYWCGC